MNKIASANININKCNKRISNIKYKMIIECINEKRDINPTLRIPNLYDYRTSRTIVFLIQS